MSKLNKHAYQELIDGNIAWLEKQPQTLERDHTLGVLRASVDLLYPEIQRPDLEAAAKRLADAVNGNWLTINHEHESDLPKGCEYCSVRFERGDFDKIDHAPDCVVTLAKSILATGPAAQGPAERRQDRHSQKWHMRHNTALDRRERPHVARGDDRRKYLGVDYEIAGMDRLGLKDGRRKLTDRRAGAKAGEHR